MRTAAIIAATGLAFALAACGQPAAPVNDQTINEAAEVQATDKSQARDDEAIDLSVAPSGKYITDPKHRYIAFSYLHQGYSRPQLRWRDWRGELDWNAKTPEESSVMVTIDARSIDSGVDEFDEHLRSADFFDVANHPTITFESTSVERTGPNTGKVTGNLAIKGIVKPVTLDVVLNRAGSDPQSNQPKLGFSARGEVNRSDFDLDQYVPFVGDKVTLVIETEFQSESG